MTHERIFKPILIYVYNLDPRNDRKKARLNGFVYKCVLSYRREGALSKDFAEFEILGSLLARLSRLRGRGLALHAVDVAMRCFLLTSYHGWARAETRGVEGYDIILHKQTESRVSIM